jgi:hypothetical protein
MSSITAIVMMIICIIGIIINTLDIGLEIPEEYPSLKRIVLKALIVLMDSGCIFYFASFL